jgi:hypothetical protein
VTKSNLFSANAPLARYNGTFNQITSSANAAQESPAIDAMRASQGSFTLLIADMQRFNALNASETGLLAATPHGNASIENAL